MTLRNSLAVTVIAIGSLQMLGHLTGSRMLRGIGLASGIAPYTKVFCAADGYEPFAARFHLTGTRGDGSIWRLELSPEIYARLRGPYNRRNVHGAALAFAPRLPAELRRVLLDDALAPGSAMRRELGIPTDLTALRVHVTPRAGETEGPWIYPQAELLASDK